MGLLWQASRKNGINRREERNSIQIDCRSYSPYQLDASSSISIREKQYLGQTGSFARRWLSRSAIRGSDDDDNIEGKEFECFLSFPFGVKVFAIGFEAERDINRVEAASLRPLSWSNSSLSFNLARSGYFNARSSSARSIKDTVSPKRAFVCMRELKLITWMLNRTSFSLLFARSGPKTSKWNGKGKQVARSLTYFASERLIGIIASISQPVRQEQMILNWLRMQHISHDPYSSPCSRWRSYVGQRSNWARFDVAHPTTNQCRKRRPSLP